MEKLSFAIENGKIIEENKDSNFFTVSLDFFASGDNLHNLYVSEETLLKTANTIRNRPIVWKYDIYRDDIYTHDDEEVPCGYVPLEANVETKRLPDGRLMLSTIGYIWKRYTGELLRIFKRDSGEKPVSVEMIVKNTKVREDGVTELVDYVYEGITLLGSKMTPAILNASATVLAFEYRHDLEQEFPDVAKSIDWNLPKESTFSENERVQENIEKENPMPNDKEKIIDLEEEIVFEESIEKQEEEMSLEAESEVPEKSFEEDDMEDKEESVEEEECAKEKEECSVESEQEKQAEEKEDFSNEISKIENVLSVAKGEFESVSEAIDAAIVAYSEMKEELDKLSLFKEEVEFAQKESRVKQIIQELKSKVVVPEEEELEMLEESKNYSYENISTWEQLCKAKSFDFTPIINEDDGEDKITKVSLPLWGKAPKQEDDIWASN